MSNVTIFPVLSQFGKCHKVHLNEKTMLVFDLVLRSTKIPIAMKLLTVVYHDSNSGSWGVFIDTCKSLEVTLSTGLFSLVT